METNVLDERLRFIRDFESEHWSMTERCERYGVTRPTGYKWLARHRAGGRAGLADRSRAPQACPHRTGDATEALIVEARQAYGRCRPTIRIRCGPPTSKANSAPATALTAIR